MSDIISRTQNDSNVVTLLSDLEKVTDFASLKLFLWKLTHDIGANNFIYGSLSPVSYVRPITTIVNGYPDGWRERYCEADYIKLDPTVKHCQNSSLPLWWSDISMTSDKNVNAFFDEASDFGLNDGLSLAVQGFGRDWGMLSFSTLKLLDNNAKAQLLVNASVCAPFIHETVSRLVYEESQIERNIVTRLTPREKEVLLWTAEGKTTYEVSIILSISERTVIFHHQNLARKLQVRNRVHAVAKAISLGILNPYY